jgi:hypothetical protein
VFLPTRMWRVRALGAGPVESAVDREKYHEEWLRDVAYSHYLVTNTIATLAVDITRHMITSCPSISDASRR